MKRLIINADDLGLTSGVNRGVLAGHAAGAITSATLMANSRRFHEAASLVSKSDTLGVGCHVVLVDGAPISAPERVGSLLAPGGNGERVFRDSWAGFAYGVLRGKIKPAEIETEALAQMERIRSHGVAITHFDSHKHTHMLWAVLEPLMRAAKQMGVEKLRNPFEPGWAVRLRSFRGLPGQWVRPAEVTILRRLLPGLRRLARKYGMRHPDGTIGVALTGSLDEESFHRLLRAIPDGTWEMVCHPGYNDEDLRASGSRLCASREKELALLSAGMTRAIIRQQGIELITFREL